MSVGRKKLSVCQNNVAAFSCCCKVLQYQQTIYWLNVNNIRYAADTAIVADSEEQLQNLSTVIADKSRKFGLAINKRKNFCMTVSKKNLSPKCKLDIDGTEIKQVDKFEYLGSLLTSDAKSDQEIKRRIAKQHLNVCPTYSLQETLTIKPN